MPKTILIDWLLPGHLTHPQNHLVFGASPCGGRGLFVTGPTTPNLPLATIPLSHVLTASNGISRDPRVSSLLSKLPSPTPSLAIILSLAYAKCGGPIPSFWSPYLSLLPQDTNSFIHLGLTDSSKDAACAALLAGLDGLSERVMMERRALRDGCAALNALDGSLTVDTLAWAHSMFASRAMSIPTLGPAMVPLFDTCNHRYHAPSVFTLGAHYPPPTDQPYPLVSLAEGKHDTTLPSSVFACLLAGCISTAPAGVNKKPLLPTSLAPSSTSLSLSLTCSLKDGEEVLISYGNKTTFSFALLSGFLPGPNQVDSVRVALQQHSPTPSLSLAPMDYPGPVFTLRACAGESVPLDFLLAVGEVVLGRAASDPPPFNPALSEAQAYIQGLGGEDGRRVVQWVVQQCEGLRGEVKEPPALFELPLPPPPAAWVALAAGVREAAVRVLDTAIGEMLQCCC